MHVAKYTRSSAGHLLAHYERRKDEKGNYVTDGRKNINAEKTHLNYAVGNNGFPMDRLKWILSREDVKCLNRADVNVLCDVVLTVPQDLPKSEHEKFFEVGYNFLCNRYGLKNQLGNYENVLSSWVHNDETTPHLHFAFVPLKKTKKIDKKTQKEIEYYKVSAKQVINRTDLQTLHKDMAKEMKNAFGYDIAILNDATKEGNQTVEQLKYKSKIQKEIIIKEQELNSLNYKIAQAETGNELVQNILDIEYTYKEVKNDIDLISKDRSDDTINATIEKWNAPIRKVNRYDYNENKVSILFELKNFLKSILEHFKSILETVLNKPYENVFKDNLEHTENKYKDNIEDDFEDFGY